MSRPCGFGNHLGEIVPVLLGDVLKSTLYNYSITFFKRRIKSLASEPVGNNEGFKEFCRCFSNKCYFCNTVCSYVNRGEEAKWQHLMRGAFRKLKTSKSSYLYQIILILFLSCIGCLFSVSFSIVASLIVDHSGEVSYRDCPLLQRGLWSRSSGNFGCCLRSFNYNNKGCFVKYWKLSCSEKKN
jgi:hypothetical protein